MLHPLNKGPVGPINRLRQLPAPADIDPQLTEELLRQEQYFASAIQHKDAEGLERIVAAEFTLPVADIPQSSLPRAIWMRNTLDQPSVVGMRLEITAIDASGGSFPKRDALPSASSGHLAASLTLRSRPFVSAVLLVVKHNAKAVH